VVLDSVCVDPESPISREAIEDLKIPATHELIRFRVVYFEMQFLEVFTFKPSPDSSLENLPIARQLLRIQSTEPDNIFE